MFGLGLQDAEMEMDLDRDGWKAYTSEVYKGRSWRERSGYVRAIGDIPQRAGG